MRDHGTRSRPTRRPLSPEAQAGAAARGRGRAAKWDLATRLALVAVVAGPSLVCAALVTNTPAGAISPVVVVESAAHPASIVPPEPSCEIEVHPAPTPVSEPAMPAAPRSIGTGNLVTAMSPWGVLLTNDADPEWATGRVAAHDFGAERNSSDVASKAVELALVDEALRRRIGTKVIGYGPEGEVCRGLVGTPRLVRVFNGWQDMLGGEEPRLVAYDDAEPPKLAPRVIRNAVWAHVDTTWLVAPIVDEATGHPLACKQALLVADADAEIESLRKVDEPERRGLVAERIAEFLASPDVRELRRHHQEYLASLGPDVEGGEGSDGGDVEKPLDWDAFVSRGLRVRAYVADDGRLVALALSLEDLEAEGCGIGFWGSATRLEHLDETGHWQDIGRSFPDAAIVTPSAFVDATRVLDLDDGVVMHLRWLQDLPARAAMLAAPRDPEGPDLGATWEQHTSDAYSALAYFEGCPC